MDVNVFFNNATSAIKDFLQLEFKTMGSEDVEKLLSNFYRLTNYEEEGLKIRPQIILTSNINILVKNIENCTKVCFYTDSDSNNFNERLKALMCFCNAGWMMYINFAGDNVEYGLVRALSSIKDKTLEKIIFQTETRELLAQKIKMVLINVISSGFVSLKGIQGNKTKICFNLYGNIDYNWSESIRRFVNDCLSKLKTTPRKLQDIKNLYENIFSNVFRKIHGTLCLIVDKEFVDNKGVFSDGTWLPEPIEFGKLFLQSNSFSESKLRAYADLLLTMLNYDGITIVDNSGRIRAYNVFVENSKSATKNVVGGARLRAAYTMLNTNNKKVIGVYFQSHEGDSFYKSTQEVKKELSGKVLTLQNFKQLEMNIDNKQENR